MAEPKSILIIQLKRAGDVILTTPIPAALKKRFPSTTIGFLVEKAFAPLLEHNPSIDQIHRYDKQSPLASVREIRRAAYPWIFDFQSSPRSAVVVLTSGADLTAGYRVPFWGLFYKKTIKRPGGGTFVVDGKLALVKSILTELPPPRPPEIFLTPPERAAAEHFGNSNGRPVIGIVPTHRRHSRRWHADSFAGLARALLEKNYVVWLFWGPGEQAEVEALQKSAPGSLMIPATSLREMTALLARCQCVVTNDNGPMHLAHAAGTPTVTIYGPTDPLAWNPGGPRHVALQAPEVTCLGCNLNECPFEHECMTHLSPETVLRATEKILAATPHPAGMS